MKNLRLKYNTEVKSKIINGIMTKGKKQTGEIILTKCFKKIQKECKKHCMDLWHVSIAEVSPAVKINYQVTKRGKRKNRNEKPTFIRNESLRTILAIKLITSSALKKQIGSNFSTKLANEIQANANFKSFSIEAKNEIQKQVLLKKRYINKFRW